MLLPSHHWSLGVGDVRPFGFKGPRKSGSAVARTVSRTFCPPRAVDVGLHGCPIFWEADRPVWLLPAVACRSVGRSETGHRLPRAAMLTMCPPGAGSGMWQSLSLMPPGHTSRFGFPFSSLSRQMSSFNAQLTTYFPFATLLRWGWWLWCQNWFPKICCCCFEISWRNSW